MSLMLPPYLEASFSKLLHVTMQTRLYHDLFRDLYRFEPLGPTPLRDSRSAFMTVVNLARDCLLRDVPRLDRFFD